LNQYNLFTDPIYVERVRNFGCSKQPRCTGYSENGGNSLFPINPFKWHVRDVARPRNMNLGAWQTRGGQERDVRPARDTYTHVSLGGNDRGYVCTRICNSGSRVYAYATLFPSELSHHAARLWAVCMGITLLMYGWSGAVYGICRRRRA